MDLNKPISYQTFKSLPDDLKLQYIIRQQNLYGATQRMFAELFDCGVTTIGRIYSHLKISSDNRGRKPTRRQMESWKAFCGGIIGGGEMSKESKIETTCTGIIRNPISSEEVPSGKKGILPDSIIVKFSNVVAWESLIGHLRQLDISNGANIEIKIEMNDS